MIFADFRELCGGFISTFHFLISSSYLHTLRMATMLEQLRALHEEIEALELAAVGTLESKGKSVSSWPRSAAFT